MCGIAGKIYFNQGQVRQKDLLDMSNKIAYRGPDDAGTFISQDKRVGLANRRLAIIDLSPKGHQPMQYANRYWITFNGEIYNFELLRKKLVRFGYRFRSNTDTEVILALYDKYKVGCLKYLRGMFAFAIYDAKENNVFLARDRIGVKPLKYFNNGSVFIFASELKAILTQKEVNLNPDFKAIRMYLSYSYVPSPLTGFVGIKKLEPGHYIAIDLNRNLLTMKKYWEPIYRDKLKLREKDWINKILDTLDEATRLRMIADVPIGAFLSGGVDSSAVVATMARLSKKPVETFTIIFDNNKMSEEKYAKNIVKIYNTKHHELLVKPGSIDLLPELAYQYEEPFADASNVITYLVSKMARKSVVVVLNGDGGDENFAGYPNRYLRLKRDVDFSRWLSVLRPLAISALRSLNKISKTKTIERGTNFFIKSKLPLYRKFISYNQIFGLEEINGLTTGNLAKYDYSEEIFEPVERCFNLFKGRDLKDAGLKFDLIYYLPDDLLAKVDISSMAVSLEARSPFLDQEMVELACKIPFSLKVKNGQSKYILKKALEKIIPKENIYRPKMGFTLPLDKWFMERDFKNYSKNVLLSKKTVIRKYFNIDLIKKMLETHSSANDFGPRLWSLLSLELWFQSYFK
ncbi:asparagine synthase (glutamine-hydrolyzing) [Candidatus Woesebacteria bacterium RIFCSPHIGHO2_02_FULL_39_13]|uniref:asparagine synthase (glutamine-hydrolyzing) n=1 Tax=Candidatus Woesebacteria bacterium RIFCSPHIGHO2_02_FULL_39_13 TaxID=1802505 RepID=A0A1F7YZT4_9BACT|nr:MAG: asparagine synthase (glutamine-hydrolyzing) [Candidatus Woesebacteria bacterium RIFCSPHIGHO2_01_FULL_39_95]OGM32866.1 MAG: asparagine synthase (glutamine-hydrolyzing) [Candidatus Woesebacteria bacterium RIFCSPHIGHO2_02_FULL_39_13]OGM74379.1 MAG: asparagine synthase (glutamine-hydrolyzing) [Candidatus Woesebacteria bacterium RIFCSPLOWO2_12_FULL_39_9]